MAEKKVPIAVPDKSRVTLEFPRKNLEKRKTQNAESSAPAKENRVAGLKNGMAANGINPESTAPNVAPEHTPMIPGSARGLRKNPWNTAPVPPRSAPHIMLIKIRGSLILVMIVSSVLEQVRKITESGEMNLVPMQSAISPVRNKATMGRIFQMTDMHPARFCFMFEFYGQRIFASFSTASTQRGVERTNLSSSPM